MKTPQGDWLHSPLNSLRQKQHESRLRRSTPMPRLNPTQIAIALKTPRVPKCNKDIFVYEPAIYDALIEGMFGRRWGDEHDETFPPHAKEIWSALFRQCLGDSIDFDEVPLVIGVAERTKSDVLREKAVRALEMHIVDCSGTDDSLKPKVKETLTTLREVFAA
jgi:hypothetical protein